MQIESAKKQLFDLRVSVKNTEFQLTSLLEKIKEKEESVTNLKQRMTYLHIAENILQEVVEKISRQNLQKIETFVNRALSLIFPDINLSFQIEQSVKRGNNVYSFVIMKDKIQGSIHSFGGGVLAVIAVVLKVLFNIVTKRFPLLVFDETLSFLAVNYIPAMSEFLKTLSQEFDTPILLVTHQKEFAIAADNCYEVSLDSQGNTILNQISGQ
jgi:DNA repair ATPase RecN